MDITADAYTEHLVFFYVIRSYEMTSKYESKYFGQERLRKLFDVIKPYIMQYREEPSEDMVFKLLQAQGLTTDLTQDILHSIWQIRNSIGSYASEWLKTSARGYAEWNNFLVAVNRMHSYMMTTQYDITPETAHEYVQKVKAMFTSDANFTMNDSVGHDFFDPEEHQQSVVEAKSTGYKFFDLCLHGGWAKKTLNIIMGPPKVGKSMWLCNMCANSVMAGDNCAYITLEMSTQIVNQRIGANLLNIPINEYDKYAMDCNLMTKKLQDLRRNSFTPLGALIVEEFPTSSATVYDLEAFLLNAEKTRSTDEHEFKFRNVYIDYVNIMADARHGNASETYMKIKAICEDVRAMCQRNDWCGISLTQTNRSGMNVSDLDMTSVAESSGLVATVDSLFGIICTPMMKAEGVYYIKALALRNSPNMGDKKKYLFQGDFMRISEDDMEDIIPDTVPIPSEFTAGLPQKDNGGKPWKPKTEGQRPAGDTIVVPQTPGIQAPPPTGASLGVIENKINQQDLFSV